ncbi:hypothetical protein [Ferrimonas gelatinilytica]|uniref:Uncharacterized protein n=1 Tax=Ferrimonas gelatinilytica TaxID=1255257 RepID=A0ABP9SCT9_9GAMM
MSIGWLYPVAKEDTMTLYTPSVSPPRSPQDEAVATTPPLTLGPRNRLCVRRVEPLAVHLSGYRISYLAAATAKAPGIPGGFANGAVARPSQERTVWQLLLEDPQEGYRLTLASDLDTQLSTLLG